MLIFQNDDFITSKSTSFNSWYWGSIRFMFTNYDEYDIESVNRVKIVPRIDSGKSEVRQLEKKILKTPMNYTPVKTVRFQMKQEFEIWQPKKHRLMMTIHNTSDENVKIMIKQKFDTETQFELDENIDLRAREMKHIREIRSESNLEFNIDNSKVEKGHICWDEDIFILSVKIATL